MNSFKDLGTTESITFTGVDVSTKARRFFIFIVDRNNMKPILRLHDQVGDVPSGVYHCKGKISYNFKGGDHGDQWFAYDSVSRTAELVDKETMEAFINL